MGHGAAPSGYRAAAPLRGVSAASATGFSPGRDHPERDRRGPGRGAFGIVRGAPGAYRDPMIERRFARTNESLEAIYGFIREFLAGQGLAQEHAFTVDLIAEELFTNMVKYNRPGAHEIAMGLDYAAPTLTLRLRDFDVGRFDVTAAPGVDIEAPIERRRAGGLGLHLVRQMADDIHYNYDDRTSTVTVTRRLTL